MLSTEEIINQWHKQEWDILMKNFGLTFEGIGKSEHICMHILQECHMNLIPLMFNFNTVSERTVKIMVEKPALYPIFQQLLESDQKLREKIGKKFLNMQTIGKNMNTDIMNILLQFYQPNSDLLYYVLLSNNTNTIDVLFEKGYDIDSLFQELVSSLFGRNHEVKISTYQYLEKYGIDIHKHLDKLGTIFFDAIYIEGLKYCLEHGANANYILKNINILFVRGYGKSYIDVFNLLMIYKPDPNCLDMSEITCLIGKDENLYILKSLVENGLNVSVHFAELLICVVRNDCIEILKHLILLGADVKFENDLLFIYACRLGNIKIIKLLLEYGFDRTTILSFINMDLSIYYDKYPRLDNHINKVQLYNVTKILIENGAVIMNPFQLFCSLVQFCIYYEDDLFVQILDHDIDLNQKISPAIEISNFETSFILEATTVMPGSELTKLCLKYGADPCINNHGPLERAIRRDRTDVAEILLELGSKLNSNALNIIEYIMGANMKNLLEKYGYEVANRIKIDKINT